MTWKDLWATLIQKQGAAGQYILIWFHLFFKNETKAVDSYRYIDMQVNAQGSGITYTKLLTVEGEDKSEWGGEVELLLFTLHTYNLLTFYIERVLFV